MNLTEFYTDLAKIERTIRDKGLIPYVTGCVNWVGDEVSISVRASEPHDVNGHWQREKSFDGDAADAHKLLRAAWEWVHAIPSDEDRAIELMVQKLNKLAGELPKGSTDIAAAAWKEVHTMLIAKAERIARNGLPSPNSISALSA